MAHEEETNLKIEHVLAVTDLDAESPAEQHLLIHMRVLLDTGEKGNIVLHGTLTGNHLIPEDQVKELLDDIVIPAIGDVTVARILQRSALFIPPSLGQALRTLYAMPLRMAVLKKKLAAMRSGVKHMQIGLDRRNKRIQDLQVDLKMLRNQLAAASTLVAPEG